MGLCGLYKKLPKSQKSLQTFIMVPRKSASIEKARRLRLKSPIYTAGQKNSLCGSGGRAVGEERERERDCVCSNHTHTHTTVLLRQKALPPDSQREGKKERERFCGHLLSPSLSSYSPPPLKEKGPSLLSLSFPCHSSKWPDSVRDKNKDGAAAEANFSPVTQRVKRRLLRTKKDYGCNKEREGGKGNTHTHTCFVMPLDNFANTVAAAAAAARDRSRRKLHNHRKGSPRPGPPE